MLYFFVQCCANCDKPKNAGDVVVKTDREDFDRVWCPECFQCSECKELLVDLIYFYHDSKIYCGRHYCELLKPRCAACDEVISIRTHFLNWLQFQQYIFLAQLIPPTDTKYGKSKLQEGVFYSCSLLNVKQLHCCQ